MFNPYSVVDEFEKTIAEWAGAKYGVAVESCTAALFLSLKYLGIEGKTVYLPKFTYPGVAASVKNAGGRCVFEDKEWSGVYRLSPFNIYDSALRLKKGMYVPDSLYCLSFHIKKHLPIGRGGMILTDSKEAYDWLKKMRFDGRTEGADFKTDYMELCGWNMYMTPEQAIRGLQLFSLIKDRGNEDLPFEAQDYPDLSKCPAFN